MNVSIRKRKKKDGQESLYLDYYLPKAKQKRRKESLNLYLYSLPSTSKERAHNKKTSLLAESIRSKRFLEMQQDAHGFSNIAKENGWVKKADIQKKNKGRTIYTDPKDGKHYSLDTQHGTFEVLNKKGKHQGEVDFGGNKKKDADTTGAHDINI